MLLRSHHQGCLAGLLAMGASLALVSTQALALSFEQALQLARQDSPALSAAQAQTDAARSAAIPAGELPDPQLTLGLENIPIEGQNRFAFTREPMSMQRIGVMQNIPNRDKRDARIALAEARIGRARAEQQIITQTAQREAALAWIRRQTLESQLDYLDGLYAENRLLAVAVQAQLAGGRAMPADAVMPRQEAALLDERRDALRAQRQQAIAALQRWIGDAAQADLTGQPPRLPIRLDTLSQHLHAHPELAAFDSEREIREAEVREARAMKTPDWGLGLTYQRRGREFGDMVSLQVTVDLPLLSASRQDPLIAAREAERAGVDAERDAVLREHQQMLASDFADYQRLDQAFKRSQTTLIPLAKERIALNMASYSAGRTSLTEVIAARREGLETELNAMAIEGERRQVAAKLYFAYSDPAVLEANP